MTRRTVSTAAATLSVMLALPAAADTQTLFDVRAQLADRLAQCCNVGALTGVARNTAVTPGATLDIDGRVDAASIHLIRAGAAPDAAVQEACKAARRAVIRCGASGFDLPRARLDDWRILELTFDSRDQLM